MDEQINTEKTKNLKIIYVTLASLAVLFCVYVFFQSVPKDFPLGKVFTVESGASLKEISETLKNEKVIKYPFIFRAHVILLGGEKKVMAGDYLLDKREGSADLAFRFINGRFHLEVVKITIPEGWNIFQISDYLDDTLIGFDKSRFLSLAKNKEGYLFPDTYFVSPAIKAEDIISRMSKNFEAKIKNLSGFATSTYSLKEIITMASILEEEAKTSSARRVVAGILWKRFSIGMPLQVDSTFSYVNGKNTYELTVEDLKIDSPYNTYVYKGFPPTPISNPGLESIVDAMNPTKTKYLYFLSSRSGEMYYSTTFEGHKKNKELYLNK